MSTAKSLVQWQNESKRIRVDAWLSLHQELDTDAHEFDPKAIHCQVVNCPGTDVTFIIILAHIYWLIFATNVAVRFLSSGKTVLHKVKCVCLFLRRIIWHEFKFQWGFEKLNQSLQLHCVVISVGEEYIWRQINTSFEGESLMCPSFGSSQY